MSIETTCVMSGLAHGRRTAEWRVTGWSARHSTDVSYLACGECAYYPKYEPAEGDRLELAPAAE